MYPYFLYMLQKGALTMNVVSRAALRSSAVKFFLLCMAISLAGLTTGCGNREETPPPPKNAVSLENLQTACGVSMKRQRMYDRFIPQAEKDKYPGVASLYKALSVAEGIQADNHAALLRRNGVEPVPPVYDSIVVGTTMQTMKMAISSEELECNSMYPNLIRTAMAEEFNEGVDQFNNCHAVEERHADLLKDAQNKNGRLGKIKFFVCPGCGYIFTSDKTEECPVCKKTKDTFIAI